MQYFTLEYVLKRAILLFITLFLVLTINFLLLHLTPGDPISILSGSFSPPPQLRASIEAAYGLDKPLYLQYVFYLYQALQFNLGISIAYGVPVSGILLRALPATLALLISSLSLICASGILLTLASAKLRGTRLEISFSLATLAGYSIPVFWLGQLLVLFLALNFPILPTFGMTSLTQGSSLSYIADELKHIILPTITLAAAEISVLSRIGRAKILEVLGEKYIITAASKGLAPRQILFRHAFKNTAVVLITVIGYRIAYVVASLIVVEYLFAWPGVGNMLIQAIFARDYTLALGIFYLVTILVLVASLVTDLVYSRIDPRIKLG